ncbi:hypothetical protein [Vagococcus fluvialis]|uniref:hypothetical protein n=1 Tax=Vagococcus fluvialis TaxID=2738 RepID=UPI003D12EE6F
MVKINENEYKLVLIDSNVISEIIYNGNIDSPTFFNYIIENQAVICFTFYNVLEIKNGYNERWDKFVKIFSMYPCVILKPFWSITFDEIDMFKNKKTGIYPIFNHFSMLGKDDSYNFKKWIDEVLLLAEGSLAYEQNLFQDTIDYFNSRRELSEIRIRQEFYKKMKIDRLDSILKREITAERLHKSNDFQSIKIMYQSFFHRYKNLKRDLRISDMNDIAINAVVPYIDIIITEKYQSQVLKEMKLENSKSFRISDFFDGKEYPIL